ncbi:hypothetical protein [Cereibacter changlensis]|uniref:hypothetical protein n=1 Tax=Cereibacter changlensis TaxID=402884 RepID=UPI004033AE7F
MIDDANALAACLAYSAADLKTYSAEPQWVDTSGNKYSIASCPVQPGFFEAAYSELVRPVWDEEPYLVDMIGAARAQAAVQLVDGNTVDDEGMPLPFSASPMKLLAVMGEEPLAIIARAGVSRIPVSEEELL